jgi:hypothetical protein
MHIVVKLYFCSFSGNIDTEKVPKILQYKIIQSNLVSSESQKQRANIYCQVSAAYPLVHIHSCTLVRKCDNFISKYIPSLLSLALLLFLLPLSPLLSLPFKSSPSHVANKFKSGFESKESIFSWSAALALSITLLSLSLSSFSLSPLLNSLSSFPS